MNSQEIETGVKHILKGLDIDLEDRNYADTPKRFAKMLKEMFSPSETNFPTFEEEYSGLILIRGHKIFTLCPHHLALVSLNIDMAYLPTKEVYGLSKLPRIANSLNTKPLLQEEFTRKLADKLNSIPGCRGSAVVVTATHGCMQVRGVKTHADAVTSSAKGEFLSPEVWQNFLELRRNK